MEGAVEALGPVHALLNVLVQRICRRLERRQGAADRIEWTCLLADGAEHAGQVVPAFPTRDPAAIDTLLRAAVDARPPRAPVTGVRVRAWPVHASPAQESFDGPTRPNPRRLAETLARLAALVGGERRRPGDPRYPPRGRGPPRSVHPARGVQGVAPKDRGEDREHRGRGSRQHPATQAVALDRPGRSR